MEKLAVMAFSGGLDSTTLAFKLRDEGYALSLLGFDYGQRHVRELRAARTLASLLGAPFNVVDLRTVSKLIQSSALTNSSIDVPEGHYAADNMAITVVPNRNAMMLSICFAHASSIKAEIVATGVHAGDHAQYPDCRPEFANAFDTMEGWALDAFDRPLLATPFIRMTKTEIAKLAGKLSVPIGMTWSCYKGGEVHDGRCSTCVERLQAIHEAGLDDKDTTVYADRESWKQVVFDWDARHSG